MKFSRFSFFLLPYLLLFIVGLASIFIFEKPHLFHSLQIENSFLDALFPWLTHLGDGVFYIIIILGFLFFSLKNSILALASYTCSSLTTQVLKRFVFEDALRPSYYFNDASYHIVEGVDLHGTLSFPSGHATTAFSIALFLTLISRTPKWGILYFFAAAIISYTRIYLSQHFPEDVLAGSFIGVALTLLMFFLLEKRIPNSWDVSLKSVVERSRDAR